MQKPSLYYFSAFICGMAVMAVELSASRLLAPYFGNSLYVWTNIIGLIMVALALGYYLGGRLADKRPSPNVYFSLILITGVWTLLIPFFSPILLGALSKGFENLAVATKWGSFLGVLLLFVVPLFMLGMVVPFTVKLVIQKVDHLGSQSGQISTISTAGSLVGTFLPAFVLNPTLGTTKTFVFLGLVLFFLAAFGLRKWWLFLSAMVSLALFWLVPPVYASARIIHAEDSVYGYVFVTEDGEGIRRLHIDNPLGTQSIYDPHSVLPEERYYYSYFGALPAMIDEPQKVLILGHAGGSFTRIFNAFYPELEITGVEIDPIVTKVAQDYLGLSEADVEIVHADARAFLNKTEESYDLILVDTYHGMNIPAHLATEEFFAAAEARLNPGGIVAINVATGTSQFLDVFFNTVAKTFEQTALFPIPDSYNVMVAARNEGEFVFQTAPKGLQEKATALQATLTLVPYLENLTVFEDDKMASVELLMEEMQMQVLKGFKQD